MPVPAAAPTHRQIRAVLGNRTVVFGSAQDDGPLAFTPESDSVVVVPRVAGPTEALLLQHLKVSGHEVTEYASPGDDLGDLMLVSPDGARVIVEIKLREGQPTEREKERFAAEVTARTLEGNPVEVWRFSSDRVSLHVSSLAGGKVRHETLIPLNVWEATSEGIFDRAKVLERIADWESRLSSLFAQVEGWIADRSDLHVDRTRTVGMSEELMRNFGVPDRELPILDVLEGEDAIASLVPKALWIIGGDGRVDLIARSGTHILVYQRESGSSGWRVADRSRRTNLSVLDKQNFLELLEAR